MTRLAPFFIRLHVHVYWMAVARNKVTSHGDSLMRPAKVNDYLKASNFDE